MKKFLLTTLFALIGTWVFAQASIPEGLLYEVIDGRTVTITGYKGSALTLSIPEQIEGKPVTAINRLAFEYSSGIFATDGGDIMIAGDSLTSITIPSSVSSMGNGALANCSNLTSINVDNRNSVYASRDGVLFDKNIRTIIAYPAGIKEKTYAIPSSVRAIGDWAFSGCYKLPGITIPSSVSSIGEMAFSFCRNLTSITIPSSVTSIGEGAFLFCDSLTSITIPSSVTSISVMAFYHCGNLTSISIPSSVTSIGDSAFSYCRNLTSITIPSSVTSIGDSVFYGCGNLTSITIPSSVTSIGDRAFYDCRKLTSVSITRRTKVGENTFPLSTQITYSDADTIPDEIMSKGVLSRKSLFDFLLKNNPGMDRNMAITIVDFYIYEANDEGVNYEIAFAQMCYHTNYLSFYKTLASANSNNFYGCSTANNYHTIHNFSSIQEGIRAHIQHLKGYASREKLINASVDPRFNKIQEVHGWGSSPTLSGLSNRWAGPDYAQKVIAILGRMYQ